MLERFNETDLLAFIEDELAPAPAAVLHAELARDPEAAAVVDRLRRDRSLLRALPEPSVPAQVLAGLEQWMAKPMLIESPGTQWRAQQSRARHRRWALVGMAAGLSLAGLTSLWFMMGRGTTTTPGHFVAEETTATDDRAAGMLAMTEPGSARVGADSAGSTTTTALDRADAPSGAVRAALPTISGSQPALVAADFALVIETADTAAALAALQGHAEQDRARLALVRNLTYAEADRLTREHLARAAARRRAEEPAVADGASPGGVRPALKLDAIPTNPRPLATGAGVSEASGLIAGRRELGASLDQQLIYSQSGANLTLSIPVAQLQDLLVQLRREGSTETRLQRLPAPAAPGAAMPPLPEPTAGSAWLEDMPAIAASIRDLARNDPTAVLLLPVVIQLADDDRAPRP